MLCEGDPYTLIEGMVIAAHAIGCHGGLHLLPLRVPRRHHHPAPGDRDRLRARLPRRDVIGTDLSFDLEVRVGAGAYICGEETSMLDSLEGRRGEVRAKPPIPAVHGLFGQPTVINNLLTFAAVPMILADGGAAYAALGTGRSRGTQVFQLAGNIARGGIVETDFGISLR